MALPTAGRRADSPDGIGLVDPQGTLTWTALDAALNRASRALLATDLGPKRRVAVFAENASETLVAYVAARISGHSAVPANFHLTTTELAYILKDSEAGLVFVGPETLERGLAAAARTRSVLVVGWRCPPTDGLVNWETWLADQPDADPPTDEKPRPHLLYTSGTTGFPKGVEEPPASFRAGETVADYLKLVAEDRFSQFESCLVVGPMYHAGPLHLATSTLAAGGRTVILGRFDAEATLAAIDRHRPQTSVMVPTHFAKLLALPDDVRRRYDVTSLKLVAHTGASCPVPVKQAMIDWFGPIFFEGYGATEAGIVTAIMSDEWSAHPGSVGRPVPPYEVLVLDETGLEVPAGTEGRLCFRDRTGRGIVYHKDPAKSAAAHVAPGVFTLGEIGHVDHDGYVYITDRQSDMVVSGGVNIYPAEMERVLITHPAVADVAGIGVPDADMGEELKALVVLRGGVEAEPDELSAYCRNRLAHYKCPRSVDIVSVLERDAMGKLNKRRLRAPYWPTDRTIG